MNITTSAYDKNIGVSTVGGTSFTAQQSVGLTQTATKSGIICEPDADLVVCIRY